MRNYKIGNVSSDDVESNVVNTLVLLLTGVFIVMSCRTKLKTLVIRILGVIRFAYFPTQTDHVFGRYSDDDGFAVDPEERRYCRRVIILTGRLLHVF